jgi:hypothetical protein
MNEPIRVFSDLHLAHPVSRIERVAALRPLLEGAGTVIFNGDTWQELTFAVERRSAAMLDELRGLCAEVGCQPVFLSGNHDPGWPGPGWIELAGGRIVVTHGDALMFDGSPWKREILTNGARVLELWREHPAANTEAGERLRLAREIARALLGQSSGGFWADVQNQIIICHLSGFFHGGQGIGRKCFGGDHIGWNRHLSTARFHDLEHLFGLRQQIGFGQTFANVQTFGQHEGVGNAPAHNQLVHLVGQAF